MTARRTAHNTRPAPDAPHHGVWWERAACAELDDPELFFPLPGDHERANAAVRVCAFCPVRPECLTYALTEGIQYGIYGGVTGEERTRIRRRATRGSRGKAS